MSMAVKESRSQRTSDARVLVAVMLMSSIGMGLMGYLAFVHFSGGEGSACTYSAYFSCDAVSKSRYAKFLGVPISLIGLLFFSSFIGLALVLRRGSSRFWPRALLVAGSGWCVLYGLYLTYVELFVLQAVCPFCVASLALYLLIFLLSLRLYGGEVARTLQLYFQGEI